MMRHYRTIYNTFLLFIVYKYLLNYLTFTFFTADHLLAVFPLPTAFTLTKYFLPDFNPFTVNVVFFVVFVVDFLKFFVSEYCT